MTTNFYFNNFESSQEQSLIEDLIIESIKIYGHDMIYIKRTLGNKDDLLNEDDMPEYREAFTIEMYIKNVEGFEGEGDFLSKFGLQIRDEITFTVSQRVWTSDIGGEIESTRPYEGDLIYFPLNKKIFEVKHVEHESIFYQMGALQTYDLRCELFEYSNEIIKTGYPEVDDVFEYMVTRSSDPAFVEQSGTEVETVDPSADNLTIETFADAIVDFSEQNPFGEDDF